MLFNKSEEKKRSSFLPLAVLRVGLAVVMFAFLMLLMYQAFRYFSSSSSSEPLPANPKDALVQILQENNKLDFLPSLTSINIPKNPAEIKQFLKELSSGQVSLPKPEVLAPSGVENQPTPSGQVILKIALVSDTHNYNDNLAKALNMAKERGAKFVIGLGDWTDVGTLEDLQKVKQIFQQGDLPYYLTSGDHDLWSGRDKGLAPDIFFNQVFGSSYQSFRDSNIQFVIIYDSDNYIGVDGLQMNWITDILSKAQNDKPKNILVFMHEPLYHPTSDHMVGKTNKTLEVQAQSLRNLFKSSNVGGIFAGDAHAFSSYSDPDSGIKMYTIGSLSETSNPGGVRFSLVDIYENGNYNVEDIEVK